MVEEIAQPVDAPDLVYSGRARKRPPGASALVQRIYGLLVEHPQGITLAELHDTLRDGWLETDAYRAYEQHLNDIRLPATVQATTVAGEHKRRRPPPKVGQYGTPNFKEAAQRWWIRGKLQGMRSTGTARREGQGQVARWYAGERTPRVMVACPVPEKGYHVHPMNVHDAQVLAQTDTGARIRREQLKARILETLNDKRFKGPRRDLVQDLYDYLTGR